MLQGSMHVPRLRTAWFSLNTAYNMLYFGATSALSGFEIVTIHLLQYQVKFIYPETLFLSTQKMSFWLLMKRICILSGWSGKTNLSQWFRYPLPVSSQINLGAQDICFCLLFIIFKNIQWHKQFFRRILQHSSAVKLQNSTTPFISTGFEYTIDFFFFFQFEVNRPTQAARSCTQFVERIPDLFSFCRPAVFQATAMPHCRRPTNKISQ